MTLTLPTRKIKNKNNSSVNDQKQSCTLLATGVDNNQISPFGTFDKVLSGLACAFVKMG